LAFFNECSHVACLMEPGIIHDNNFSWRERGHEALAHILGKDIGVAVPLEAEWRLQFSPAQCGDDAGTACAVAGFFSKKSLAAFSPAACQAVAVVDAAFINVHKGFCGNTAYCFLPQKAGGFIALDVEQCFFYG
jgi:hypothetical protein